MPRLAIMCLVCLAATSASIASAQAFNPYAGSPEPAPPPLAADGTIQWGTFYKSAAMQQAYERLWNMGACRGTNKAITNPVNDNKVVIDRLPEAEFHGTVRAVTGTLAGGLIAYSEGDDPDPSAPIYVAQLHPAGVTRLTVNGPATLASITPGLVIRIRTQVDGKGRGQSPLEQIEVVTPPPGFVPDAVEPGRVSTAIGRVLSLRGKTLVMQVNAGKVRRLTVPLADAVAVKVDAAQFELIAPGDSVRIVGRAWGGDGAMGAGTVFASDVSIGKQPIEAD